YRFFAIFDQTEDADRSDDAPRMEVISAEQQHQLRELQSRAEALKEQLQRAEEQAANSTQAGETLWNFADVTAANSQAGSTLTVTSEHAIEATGTSAAEDVYKVTLTLPPGRYTALRLEALPAKLTDGRAAVGRNPADPNFVVSELTVHRLDAEGNADDTPLPLAQPRASFAQDGWPVAAAIDGDTQTGWAVSPRKHERHL